MHRAQTPQRGFVFLDSLTPVLVPVHVLAAKFVQFQAPATGRAIVAPSSTTGGKTAVNATTLERGMLG
jgi:hypothetical protein